MALSVLSVLGVATLGGGLAAGLSALVVVAVVWLIAVGLVNASRFLGELRYAVDDGHRPVPDSWSGLIDRSRTPSAECMVRPPSGR